jgi:hypothetical protein
MQQIKHPFQMGFYYHLGRSLILIGGITVLFQLLVKFIIRLHQTVFDLIPSDVFLKTNEFLYFILIMGIGIPTLMLFLSGTKAYFTRNSQIGRFIAFISVLFVTLASNASLLYGGGFYIGTIFINVGSVLLLYIILIHHRISNTPGLQQEKIGDYRNVKPNRAFVYGMIVLVLISGISSISFNAVQIAPPLVPTATRLPEDIAPNHSNTFYIMPIFEGEYSYNDTIQRHEYNM